jgi:hypothetical protein
MNQDVLTSVDRDAALESLAAELTLAAYRVALRNRTAGTWLDLGSGREESGTGDRKRDRGQKAGQVRMAR